MADVLEIETLGKLKIQLGEKILSDTLPKKAIALLVYLACTGQTYTRSQLAELFWYERAGDQSLSNLRTVLSRLRPQLENYLLITRDTVAFNFSLPHRIDVREIKEAISAASRLRTGKYSGEGLERLQKALQLYQGEFLAGTHVAEADGFEEWLAGERENLQLLVIETIHNLVLFYQNKVDYNAAGEWVQKLLELDPLREEAHRQRMLLLALSGQRSAALAHYKSYLRYLARELDVAPEASTTDLYERIRKGDFQSDLTLPLAAGNPNPAQQQLDKLGQLKRVSLFVNTPEAVLKEMAGLLVEVQYEAGQNIIQQGDVGDCMYIVIEGQVQVHIGSRVLNILSVRDIFGEMAVLESAPRSASVTAVTFTRLWRLDQETLYRLMTGRLEVVRAIISVLSSRLRERVQDVLELDARLRAITAGD